MITIVTSLYEIGREDLDGRSWENYLDWFQKTLCIDNPMVIFVDPKTKKFVEENREGKKTLIIEESIENCPYYGIKDKIDFIIQSDEYRKKIKDPDRIECKSSLYNIIQYSKFGWVERASKIDPFGTNLYLWLDAGISRFFKDLVISTDSKYPGDFFMESISDMDNEMYVQIFMSNYPDLSGGDPLSEEYLLDNRSYVCGGIFVASKKSIIEIKKEIDYILNTLMIEKNLINNEQIAIGYLLSNKKHLFKTFLNYSGLHKNYEILKKIKE